MKTQPRKKGTVVPIVWGAVVRFDVSLSIYCPLKVTSYVVNEVAFEHSEVCAVLSSCRR